MLTHTHTTTHEHTQPHTQPHAQKHITYTDPQQQQILLSEPHTGQDRPATEDPI